MSIVIKGCLPSKVVFHKWSSSIRRCLPLSDVFQQRSSSIKVCLPPKLVLPSKVVFQPRLSSIKGPLPSNVVFHRSQRLSSIKICVPSKVVFLSMSSSINPQTMGGGGNWPTRNLKCYISGTECWVDFKPGCQYKFSRCLKVYIKKMINLDLEVILEGLFWARVPWN